jgi:hypothetical protein
MLSGLPFILGCNEDVLISAPGPSIPVVYALINPEDSMHYIRISRSFKSEGDANQSAKIADSISYGKLSPRIELYTDKGWKYHELNFQPSDQFDKDEGLFTSSGLQLYECYDRLSKYLIHGTRLVLNIQPENGGRLVSSVISYVEPPRILVPKQGLHTILDFYPQPFLVTFEDPPEFIRYELHLMFEVRNVKESGDTVLQVVDKVYTRNSENHNEPRSHSAIGVNIGGDVFLAKIRQDVKEDPEVIYRLPGEMKFVLRTASAEYDYYNDFNRMADDYGGKVTTNIVGGVGVFAFRFEATVDHLYLGYFTMDSLLYGRFTRHLNFRNW